MLRRIATYLGHRLPLVILLGLLAFLAQRRLAAPPAPTVDGTAAMLASACGGEVAADGFVWEPSQGPLRDALWGRNVLFLARLDGSPRDVYRARVRVTREGHPLEVRRVTNLTSTTLADERQLSAHQRHVAFASYALGGVQGVTVLDLQGASLSDLSRSDRWLAQLDNWRHVGSALGLGRHEVIFGKPPAQLLMQLHDDQLVLAAGTPAESVALTLSSAALKVARNSHRAEAWAVPRLVRERQQYIDTLVSALSQWLAGDAPAVAAGPSAAAAATTTKPAVPPTPSTATATPDTPPWPPAALKPVAANPLDGEGSWQQPADWVPRRSDAEPPSLMVARIRPERDDPDAEVVLLAMDTRRLSLHVGAGFERPRAVTGPRGRGRIPEPLREVAVAAFNGAAQVADDDRGLVVERRVLIPPKDAAATLVLDDLGRNYLGRWTFGDVPPQNVVSLRQAGVPLIVDGVPSVARSEAGPERLTRSALGRTHAGFLIYAWGRDITATTLAKALLMAGCQQALSLDVGDANAGFTFLKAQGGDIQSARLDDNMRVPLDRYLNGSASDFFYLTMRDDTPKILSQSLTWKPAEHGQPPPVWLPAVYRAGTEKLGAKVALFAIDAGRFDWDIRPGKRERGGRTADGPLTQSEHDKVLVAVSLGVTGRRKNRRGLVLDGVHSLRMRSDKALMLTSQEVPRLSFGRMVADMEIVDDAAELEYWGEGGGLSPAARQLGPRRLRTAACRFRDGTVLVAQADFDAGEAIAQTLLDAGCRQVTELNRGRQLSGFIRWAKQDPGPAAHNDETVLFGLARRHAGSSLPLELLPRPKRAATPAD